MKFVIDASDRKSRFEPLVAPMLGPDAEETEYVHDTSGEPQATRRRLKRCINDTSYESALVHDRDPDGAVLWEVQNLAAALSVCIKIEEYKNNMCSYRMSRLASRIQKNSHAIRSYFC